MAEGIWNKITLLGLLILFISIFTFAFYSKTGLMSKIASLALGAERFLPVEPRKEVKPDESLPNAVTNTQRTFIEEISKFPETEKCLLMFTTLNDLGDYRMELSSYEGKVISKIEKLLSKEGGIKLSPVETKDNKLQVCVMEPEVFYDCYIGPQRTCKKLLYTTLDVVKISKDGIMLKDDNYKLSQLLFKPEKDKVCFVPIHSSTGDNWYKFWQVFSKWGCDVSKNTIDDDCLRLIKNEIPECSRQTSPIREEFKRFIDFMASLNSKSYENPCRKNFIFDTAKLREQYYLFFNVDGGIDLKFNNNAVPETIETAKIGYIPYAKLSSDNEADAYFAIHGEFNDNFLISPLGDYVLSDKTLIPIISPSIIAVSKNNKWILTVSTDYTRKLSPCS